MSDVQIGLDIVRAICPDTSTSTILTIPGAPKSKARPRFARGRVFSPSAEDEKVTATYLRQSFEQPMPGNVAIGCVFYRPTRQRIDVDNMLKHVLDSANGIVWNDDVQVTAVLGLVELDPGNPRTIIAIGQHESTMDRTPETRECDTCSKPFTVDWRGRKQRFCSPACNSRSRGQDLSEPIPCGFCGKPFRRRTVSNQYCSVQCGRWAYKGQRKQAAGPTPLCLDCNKPLSKKGYVRCRSCWTEARKAGAA